MLEIAITGIIKILQKNHDFESIHKKLPSWASSDLAELRNLLTENYDKEKSLYGMSLTVLTPKYMTDDEVLSFKEKWERIKAGQQNYYVVSEHSNAPVQSKLQIKKLVWTKEEGFMQVARTYICKYKVFSNGNKWEWEYVIEDVSKGGGISQSEDINFAFEACQKHWNDIASNIISSISEEVIYGPSPLSESNLQEEFNITIPPVKNDSKRDKAIKIAKEIFENSSPGELRMILSQKIEEKLKTLCSGSDIDQIIREVVYS